MLSHAWQGDSHEVRGSGGPASEAGGSQAGNQRYEEVWRKLMRRAAARPVKRETVKREIKGARERDGN